MKFALCSDLHLEFGPIKLKNTENANVLVLAGDICVSADLQDCRHPKSMDKTEKSFRYHKFFKQVCSEFLQVIYIAGNHEYYNGDFGTELQNLRERLKHLSNLHIMEKEFIEFNDVIFIAGTLWTDMNKEDPMTLYGIKKYMNDYSVIENSASDPVIFKIPSMHEGGPVKLFNTRLAKFTPEDSVREHKAMLTTIKETMESRSEPGSKFVVVGHHAPSKLSTKPQYENDVMVNGAYSSDLSEFILDNPRIKVWCHGHTHHNFDYMIGPTRIVANPRGYEGYEYQANIFKLQFIEV